MNLMEEIQNSPGQDVLGEIQRMQRSLNLVFGNKSSLVRVLERLQSPDVSEELAQEARRDDSNRAMDEVARLLHNFLTSAYSLVDHMRHHRSRLYVGTEFEQRIKQEIASRFTNDDHHIITQGLRNYVLHFGIAPIQTHFTFKPTGRVVGEGNITSNYSLPIEVLLHCEEWKAHQRDALSRIGERLEILAFVETYFAKVESFYQWLWENQAVIHAEEIESSNKLRDRARTMYESN